MSDQTIIAEESTSTTYRVLLKTGQSFTVMADWFLYDEPKYKYTFGLNGSAATTAMFASEVVAGVMRVDPESKS